MPIYEYECEKGHVTERLELSSRNENYIPCTHPDCIFVAHKRTSRSSWKFGKLDNGINVTTTKSDSW